MKRGAPLQRARQAAVSFEVTQNEFWIIDEIAERAMRLALRAGESYPRQHAAMDVTAVHANGNPLRLTELRDADEANFGHDVFGIRRHLNRETGQLGGCFVPRFSRRTG